LWHFPSFKQFPGRSFRSAFKRGFPFRPHLGPIGSSTHRKTHHPTPAASPSLPARSNNSRGYPALFAPAPAKESPQRHSQLPFRQKKTGAGWGKKKKKKQVPPVRPVSFQKNADRASPVTKARVGWGFVGRSGYRGRRLFLPRPPGRANRRHQFFDLYFGLRYKTSMVLPLRLRGLRPFLPIQIWRCTEFTRVPGPHRRTATWAGIPHFTPRFTPLSGVFPVRGPPV